MINFSWRRTLAIFNKEFIKVKQDPTTLGLIFAIPIIQIILFGYAIDLYPKHLPTALISYDHSPLTWRFIQALETTNYFDIKKNNQDEKKVRDIIKAGKVNYVLNIPGQFTHDFVRGEHPHLLLEVDASVPGVMGTAVQAVNDLQKNVFEKYLQGPLHYLNQTSPPFSVDIQALYNPSLSTHQTIVPGLLGVILTLSLSLLTSISIIEEKETGSMEILLNSPVQIIEIIIGKFLCYLLIGYLQLIIILFLATYLLFNVPIHGSIITFLIASLPFLVGNLMLGLAVSAMAKNQTQAQQMVTFFFLPSILLSGFIFPFYGMPIWAQFIGNLLPLTHYIQITSGIMLKNYNWIDVMPHLWPILIFTGFIILVSILTFKKTLD